MLYEEQNIQWKHYLNVLKLLKVYNATWDHYSLWAYCAFIQVSTYLTCQQQQKTWEQITPSLLNQNVFYELEKQERIDKFLKSTLTVSDN